MCWCGSRATQGATPIGEYLNAMADRKPTVCDSMSDERMHAYTWECFDEHFVVGIDLGARDTFSKQYHDSQ